MATYLIGYDLIKPGKDYSELIKAIKKFGDWWHCLDSTWIVKSSKTSVEIRDVLRTHVDANDHLLVAQLAGSAAWAGMSEKCGTWLKNNL